MVRRLVLAFVFASCSWSATVSDVRKGFETPPDDARIMMRWWWFGSAVTKPELAREMRQMKEGGIGGFEVQPVYPLALDDPQTEFRNLPYLSDDFLDALKFTGEEAKKLGLRLDITLGSGWPYGGPHIPVTQAAGKLRVEHAPLAAGATSVPVPSIGNGEKLITAFIGMQQVSTIENGRLIIPKGTNGASTITFFISSRSGMQVKRPAIGAEGFVLDHYNKDAIEKHLKYAGDRLLKALGPNPPYSVFSDSLEVFASDWTPDLLDEFRRRRGYDLTPLLPALIGDIGPKTADIRHDWGQTLTELGEERYLTPINDWAHDHGTKFRSQTYGTPPVILSSNALVDLPEGEAGPHWRTFSTARWAASASHLYNRPVTSSETWTWLHSPSFRATPLDMKAEADLHFLQGINQLIGHGWAYSPESAGEPGWRFYAAAVFNTHNPWWIVMPDITKYLQRVSYLMRQGKPANDVALYLPTDDAWANFTAGHDSVDRSMEELLGPALIPQILDAGYNFDFIDDRAIAASGVPYPVLVIPAAKRIPAATLAKIEAYKQKGGILIDTRGKPAFAKELASRLQPDFASSPEIGFVHRKLDDGDIYFVANTSNHAVHTKYSVRVSAALQPQWWDPFAAAPLPDPNGNLDLEPYESRVLIYSKDKSTVPPKPALTSKTDISHDWKVTFSGPPVAMPQLQSWTANEVTRYFSGTATYEKRITLTASQLSGGVAIDFGQGAPYEMAPSKGPGMRALLEAPVRESARIFVNGTDAGSVWKPPYRLEISGHLHVGENEIRVVVGNLAINEMAGRSLPDYKLLNIRFGERFTPQDMKDLQPIPSGLLGPISLMTR